MTLKYELWSVEHTNTGPNIQTKEVERPDGFSNKDYAKLVRKSYEVEGELTQQQIVIVAGPDTAIAAAS